MSSYYAQPAKKKKRRGVTRVSGGRQIPFRESGGTRRAPVLRPPRRPMFDPVQQPKPIPTAAASIPGVETALSGGVGGYDLGADPAVAAAAGLAAKQRALAQATALAKRKQAALEYGSAEGLESVLGKDYAATQKSAADNPFSVLKNIEHSYSTGVRELEEGLNAANLFYSGYRGQQLAEAARGYQQSKYDASNAYQGLLSDVSSSLAEALMQADYMEAMANLNSDGGYYDGGGDDEEWDGTEYMSPAGYNYVTRNGPIGTASIPGRSAPRRTSYPVVSPNRRTATYRPGRRTQGGV